MPLRRLLLAALAVASALLSGCAVVGVATTAATVTYGVVSTAADVAIFAGKTTVNVVGAGINAVTPSSAPPATPPPQK
jgi:hypothetical protein